MTITRYIIRTTAIALAISSAPALANHKTAQVEVSYSDLNLASQTGQKILERRIRNAVRKVCGGPEETKGSIGRPVRECIKSTTREGMVAHQLAVASFKTRLLTHRDRKVRFAVR